MPLSLLLLRRLSLSLLLLLSFLSLLFFCHDHWIIIVRIYNHYVLRNRYHRNLQFTFNSMFLFIGTLYCCCSLLLSCIVNVVVVKVAVLSLYVRAADGEGDTIGWREYLLYWCNGDNCKHFIQRRVEMKTIDKRVNTVCGPKCTYLRTICTRTSEYIFVPFLFLLS